MRFFYILPWCCAAVGSAIGSHCPPSAAGPAAPLSVQAIHKFPDGSWAENLAVRGNGNLLVTLLDRPELYEVDPRDPQEARLVHRFGGYRGLFGITETRPDVFAVAAGNFTQSGSMTPGSFALWTVSFGVADKIAVAKAVDISEALFLNGATTLTPGSSSVLVADSALGVIFNADIRSGTYAVALEDASLKPPPNASLPLGVNGLQMYNGHLYYTSTLQSLFGRVEIVQITGEALSRFEILSSSIVADDFAMDGQGNAYFVPGSQNALVQLSPEGAVQVLSDQNAALLGGVTALAFGRTRRDDRVLYATTSGGRVVRFA